MKIAILGYGVEGESVYNYYRAHYPDATFTVYDNKSEPKNPLPAGVEFVGNVTDFKGIEADLAIKTPAIPPWSVEVSGEVTTMTREFLKKCPAPVIGVTGTKGKGTTASLIKSILDAAGKNAWLVGNIGVAAFDILDQIKPDDIVVYELSSFQLWDVDVSPHVAVVLGIEPEHLDVHKDFDDYVAAKSRIAAYQSADDIVVYNAHNKYATDIALQASSLSYAYPHQDGVHVQNDKFYYGQQEICAVDKLKIPGTHNQENACAAIEAAWQWVQDPMIITQGLENFPGLPYRIQKIRELDGVSYYNDSYSSAPPATIVALQAMQAPTILIAGGLDRHLDYAGFGSSIAHSIIVKKTLLIGQTKDKIAAGLAEGSYELFDSLEDAVARARALASEGDAVLFSPGCASFDMFANFTERGDQFTEIVRSL